MATYTVNTAKHATLTANVVDTVTTARTNSGELMVREQLEVTNRGATEIYFRIDGANPTVGGDDCFIVLPGGSLRVDRVTEGSASPVVKLVSSAATPYSIAAS